MSEIPAVPQPHFPSPYQRPTVPPARAFAIERPDGARIACFAYLPQDAGGAPEAAASGQGPRDLPAGLPAPVLFLHGNGEEHGIFGPVIDAVVAGGRPAIAIDSRAQGRSTRGTAPLTYELMAEDALAALDALGIARTHVLGFSDGAIEGLLLARNHPERVASLVSDGANLTPEGVVDDEGGLAEARRINEAWAAYWQGAHADHPDVDVSLLTPTPDEAARTAELLHMMEVEPHIEASSLAAISCPVTVVVGEFDMIAPSETEAIVTGIPHADFVTVPECGHSIPKEAPDELARILLATIRRAEG